MPMSLPYPPSRTRGLAAWLYCFPLLVLVCHSPVTAWSHAPRSLLSLYPSEDSTLSIAALPQPSGGAIATRDSIITTIATILPSTATATTHSDEVGVAFRNLSLSHSSDLPARPNFCQQMVQRTTAVIVILWSLIAYISINSLIRAVNPSVFIWSAEDKDEARWIASSRSWFDRKACRWLGLCGTAHYRAARPRFGQHKLATEPPSPEESNLTSWRAFWSNGDNHSNSAEYDQFERSRREIPDYVFRHAPLVHLFSGEQFWPGDIAEHLYHTTPMLNYTPIRSQRDHPTLQDLDLLNQFQEGHYIFLTSNDNVEDRPPWMEGEKNIPDPPEDGGVLQSWADWDGRIDGDIPDDTPSERVKWYDASQSPQDGEGYITPDKLGYLDIEDTRVRDELRKRYGGEPIRMEQAGGHSDAPAVLIVMDKGNGIIDAFWFYFYSFNLGNVVLNVRFGNHVGDWEHCLVRFHYGKPKALFFSAHSAGEAYSYEAVEKIGDRPVIYSAMGTHAMYATPGIHDYILPWGLLHDQTDRGPLWDPLLNSHSYTYDYDNDAFLASTSSPDSPTGWFYYNGHWGDKFYPLGDHRQYRFAGQYHYVNGPLGPRFKHLDRHKVCQGPDEEPCVIKDYIGERKRAKRWVSTDSKSHI
ncbi:Vacuolar protein sorting-associated protein 62 [Aspergillus alliaceus]|uniref:Vacuolar protein sorting-associated protein 62 n=1 Tax=Petromyces alliaceus TaxID=209559 RepID=A0A8H6AB07_PETAA|nr:Vacuolar protein sorting-associated protein 62 [Aspergillus burnettii]